MKITALVENFSHCELTPKHGLSLYIETEQHKILFDVGPGNVLFENAAKRKIDLKAIDTVVISHGHLDHGGALKQFLKINTIAKVYIQRSAFIPHYTKVMGIRFFCGINAKLQFHPRVVVLDGNIKIDDELQVLTVTDKSRFYSTMNDTLYELKYKDSFLHEQHLLITEGEKHALIMGCGHTGVVNILNAAKSFEPKLCVGGYHLTNPNNGQMVSNEILDGIANELKTHSDIRFYTCHCTGEAAYQYLKERVPNLNYLSCGESIDF